MPTKNRKSEEERMDDAIVALAKAAWRFREVRKGWKNPIPEHIMREERPLIEAVLQFTRICPNVH